VVRTVKRASQNPSTKWKYLRTALWSKTTHTCSPSSRVFTRDKDTQDSHKTLPHLLTVSSVAVAAGVCTGVVVFLHLEASRGSVRRKSKNSQIAARSWPKKRVTETNRHRIKLQYFFNTNSTLFGVVRRWVPDC
jgi:hypothetical protein